VSLAASVSSSSVSFLWYTHPPEANSQCPAWSDCVRRVSVWLDPCGRTASPIGSDGALLGDTMKSLMLGTAWAAGRPHLPRHVRAGSQVAGWVRQDQPWSTQIPLQIADAGQRLRASSLEPSLTHNAERSQSIILLDRAEKYRQFCCLLAKKRQLSHVVAVHYPTGTASRTYRYRGHSPGLAAR
jgi:hypothetical protein